MAKKGSRAGSKPGSKAGSRITSRAGSEVGDDAQSFSTMSAGEKSTFSDNDTYDVYETDAFEEAIDKLYEKRTDTRETGLKKLITLFTSQWQFDDSVLRCETLSSMLLRCLKKGSASEASLAARALGLHAITLGSGSEAEGVWAQGRAVLVPMVQPRSSSHGSSAVARTSALEALGMLCFVGAEGEHETMETLELCEGVFSALRAAPEVKAAALRTWALLLTTVPGWHLGTPFVERLLGLLGALLHDGDVGVRTAAGDALVLVYDVCGLATLPGEADADSDMSGGGFGLEGSFEEEVGEVGPRVRARDEKREQSGTLPVPAEELSSALEALCVEDRERCGNRGAAEAGTSASAPAHTSQLVGRFAQLGSPTHASPRAAAALAQTPSRRPPLPRTPSRAAMLGGDPSESSIGLGGEASAASVEETAGGGRLSRKASSSALRSQAAAEDNGDVEGGGCLDDIKVRMLDLSKNQGDQLRRSKKERAALRASFRDILQILQHGGRAPVQRIGLKHGDSLTVDTLVGSVRLNTFRKFLAQGFQVHMQHNPLLHQVFKFRPRTERAEKLTPLEKRLYRSPASVENKARSQDRRKEREVMSAYKNNLLFP